MQIAGYAYRIRASAVIAEFHNGGATTRVLLRYVQALMTQMVQTAVCNRHHTVEQQLCRWLLLSLDRITEAARELQAARVIEYRRGVITVHRAKLAAHACECYAVVKNETDRLLASPPDSMSRAAATSAGAAMYGPEQN